MTPTANGIEDGRTLDDQVAAALDALLPGHAAAHGLAPMDMDFCRRVFAPPLDRYVRRLLALGLAGHERVLDAAAGYGQWSLAMAGLNSRVDACDKNPERMTFVQNLARELGLDLHTRVCGLDDTGYPDASFDAAFCYVAIFCTPWRESLRELARILRPGGKLYLTANGLGYQIYVWERQPNKTPDFEPREYVPQTMLNTLAYQAHGTPPVKGQIIIEPDEMREALVETGFTVQALEAEGCIDVSGGVHPPTPFFPGEHRGMTCCYEVLARKN